jgi:SAM-dependent methyltransferase
MSHAEPLLMKWFRGSGAPRPAAESGAAAARQIRRSTGLTEFTRALASKEGAAILDLGPTSPANINFLTGFGGKVCNEDVVYASKESRYFTQREDGTSGIDPEKFFSGNLQHAEHSFDAVLCWDVADFLTEPLVKPLFERLGQMLKPKGVLLAFFHTKEAAASAVHSRYNIVGGESLELEPRDDMRIQRIFNNRHMENLFQGFSSLKFFLARDSVRELLAIR